VGQEATKSPGGIIFNSQASQDEFVYHLLYGITQKKDAGYYLEIGAADPIQFNNSYFFEKRYGWQGVSIDIEPKFWEQWVKNRLNPLLIADALETNYEEVLKGFPKEIDYLSLDIDHSYDKVLSRVLKSNHVFKIITIEHDRYKYGNTYMKLERKILRDHGYYLLFPEIQIGGLSFEDWWIHPKCFSKEQLKNLMKIKSKSREYNNAILEIKKLLPSVGI
jgi:hypothetical protein